MSKQLSFRVLKTGTNDYSRKLGYKYNVKVLVNGRYSGVGRFCKTLKEVEAYKRDIRKGA